MSAFLDSPYDWLFGHKFFFFALLMALAFLGLLLDFLARRQRDARETLANTVVFVGNNGMNLLLGQAIQLACLGWLESVVPWSAPGGWFGLVLCMVGVDFCYYWRHRWEHEVHLLWVEHSVHHSSFEYNFATSLRLPLFAPLFAWIFFAPMVLLGFSAKLVIACFFLNLIYQYWVHNGRIGKLGVLDQALSTPSNHRVHHARNPEYLDKNYGGILILWDRLFGTYAAERAAPLYGLVNPIGTQNPILINTRPMVRLWTKAALEPTWRGRMRAVLGRP